MRVLFLFLLGLSVAGCGTSAQVRNLAAEQTAAFELAIEDREAVNAHLQARTQNAIQDDINALEAAHEDLVSSGVDAMADDLTEAERRELLTDIAQSRRDTDRNVNALQSRQARLQRILESQVDYLIAMQEVQAQLEESLNRDDPLTRVLRALTGDDRFDLYQQRLDRLHGEIDSAAPTLIDDMNEFLEGETNDG